MKLKIKSTGFYLRVCDYIDQVEHLSLHWRDFLDGKIDIEAVLKKLELAGFDTAQGQWFFVAYNTSQVDTPACFLWEEIFRARPNAKVILCVRDDDKTWANSWARFNYQLAAPHRFAILFYVWKIFFQRGWYGERWQAAWNNGVETSASYIDHRYNDYSNQWTYKGLESLLERQKRTMEKNYRVHINNVRKVVPEKQLLVLNINDGWEPLCKFLDKPVPDREFPFENRTGDKTKKNNFIEKYVFQSPIMLEAQQSFRKNVFVYIFCPTAAALLGVYYLRK